MLKAKLILFGTFLISIGSIAQNVGINTNGTAPNASSMLDISSTTKGLLIPRVTNAQKAAMNPLPAPAEGLTIYQTDGEEGYYYNISTTTTPNWVRLMPAYEGWQLAGNGGTTAGTDFLGTIDAEDLVIKSDNTERIRIESGGDIGINTSNPVELLHLKSDDADIDMETNGTDVSTIHYKKSRGTPSSPSIVQDGDLLGQVEFQGYDGSDYEIAAGIAGTVDDAPSGNDMPGALYFYTTPDNSTSSEYRMKIDQDGETWIDSETNGSTGSPLTLYRSTASPADGDQLEFGLYHEGSAGNYAQIAGLNAKIDDVTDGTEDSELRIGTIFGGTYYHELVIDNVGNVFPYYDNNGSLGTSADRWTQVYAVNGTINTSDMRYKKNVQPLTYGLNEIMQLSTFTYQWDHDKLLPQSGEGDLKPQNNLDNNYHIGFSAQEMQTIIPELVVVGDDVQNNLGVYYSHLAPVLTKAIQEQQGMIEELQKIIKELQKEIESLK